MNKKCVNNVIRVVRNVMDQIKIIVILAKIKQT